MKKTVVKIASILAPKKVANYAYDKLTRPQVHKLRDNEVEVLDTAQKSVFPYKGFDIQSYHWPGPGENILLIHGWEGQAENFADLILKLQAAQFNIFAFDGPSHGFSSRGKTSLFEFTELVGHFIRNYKVKKLVSHSFGGVATTYSLFANQDLNIERYVLLTTPDRFSERIDDVAKQTGITNKVKQRLIHRLNTETGFDANDLNVHDFVKKVNVEKALIIHDKNDSVIPISQSLNVHKHWEASEFESIEGTGHFRILRTEFVLEKVLGFL
ncbi:alpha/beta hydrolase [Crocinitomicaceae bacterium]|nr:alpha/beta hydrolase [Crocinitomicaceae bacterium]